MEQMTGTFLGDDGRTWTFVMTPLADSPKKPKRIKVTHYTKELLLTYQNHRCAVCSGPISLLDSHADHIVPLAEGGADDFTNLQLTHMNCNLRKGRKMLDQGRLPWA